MAKNAAGPYVAVTLLHSINGVVAVALFCLQRAVECMGSMGFGKE